MTSILHYDVESTTGAVVEWLERLDYGAERRCKVVSSRLGFAMRRLFVCVVV